MAEHRGAPHLNEPKRIAVLRVIGSLDPGQGGPVVSSTNSCLATQSQGVSNTFAFPMEPKSEDAIRPALERLAGAGVRVMPFAFTGRGSKTRRWGISVPLIAWTFRAARQHDVIHVHGTWGAATAAAVVIALLRQRPCVLSPHETLTTYDHAQTGAATRRVLKRVLRPLFLGVPRKLVMSSSLELAESVADPCPRAVVIQHAISDASTLRADARPAPGDAGLRLGFLGRLHPKKNVELVLQALATLSPDITLDVGGSGDPSYERHLRDVATSQGVAERVTWLGFVGAGEKGRFFDATDLLLMPSAFECFGMSAAEALAHGVPVVLSARTGIAEIVERYRCGLVVESTPDALCDAIERFAVDPELLRRSSERASEAAEAELSLAAHGLRLREVYTEVTA